MDDRLLAAGDDGICRGIHLVALDTDIAIARTVRVMNVEVAVCLKVGMKRQAEQTLLPRSREKIRSGGCDINQS